MSDRVVGNLTVRLDFDGSRFEQGITRAKRELASYGKATQTAKDIAKDNNFAINDTNTALNNMQTQYKGMQGTMRQYQKYNEKLKESNKDQSGAIEDNEIKMRDLQHQMVKLNDEYKHFQREALTAQSSFTKVGNVLTTVGDGVQNFGRGMTEVGQGLTRVGALGTATIGLLAKQAMEFEAGMVNVAKTTGATDAEIEKLASDIRQMALEMPIAVNELQELAFQAGRLGIEQENIASFTETMAKFGTATDMSATDAGDAFARFLNITGTGVDDLDHLSATVVDLGNNFATGEREIVNMAMGLAGSLTTVGVAENEIFGLAASMSALGINSERGATAMSKLFVNIAQDVSTNADSLKDWSKVAGMSVEEFRHAFQEDAMGAVQAFINGLGEMDDTGGDVIGTLAELGISEVRLRDSILRLAGGHETLNDALDTSRKAYKEGSALNDEYGRMMESTASQVELAKNKAKDLGIEMGQALLPAIIEVLENSDGLVKSIEGMVDWFTSLDSSVQENIIKWTALSAVLGPVISSAGQIITGAGSFISILGGVSQGIGRFSGRIQSDALPSLMEMTDSTGNVTTATLDFGGAAATAGGSKGMGALVTAVTNANPILLGLVGAGGVLALGYAAWKTWGEEVYEAGQRTKRWGTDVGEATDKALQDIQDYSQGATTQFHLMADGFNADSAAMANDFEGMGKSIEKNLLGRILKLDELIESLPETTHQALIEIHEDEKVQLEKSLDQIQKNNEKIFEIKENAAKQERDLSVTESKAILDIANETAEEYVNTLRISKEERKEILDALTGDVKNATEEQARQWIETLAEQRQGLIKDRVARRREYELSLQESGDYSDALIEERLEMWDEMERSTTDGVDSQIAALARKYPELAEVLSLATGDLLSTQQDVRESQLKSNEEILRSGELLTLGVANNMKKNRNELAWFSESTLEAGNVWNNIVFDEKTGELHTNVEKEVAKALQSETGWNALVFKLQEADLDSNVQEVIVDAILAEGRWNDLDLTTKNAIMEDGFTITVYNALDRIGEWDKIEPEIQSLILNSNTPEKVIEALKEIGIWDKVEPKVKDLPADVNPLRKEIHEGEDLISAYNRDSNPDKKNMEADNQVINQKVADSTEKWNAYNRLPNSEKKMELQNGTFQDRLEASRKSYNEFRWLPSSVTKTLKTVRETIFQNIFRKDKNYAQGTGFHTGGPALVNDETTSRFRELVMHPDGTSYVPHGRNVMLDLPRGSQVLRASQTERLLGKLPQYAQGTSLSQAVVPRGFNEQKNNDNRNEYDLLRSELNALRNDMNNQGNNQSRNATVNIETIVNNSDSDIPRILEEAAWILQGEENRLGEV